MTCRKTSRCWLGSAALVILTATSATAQENWQWGAEIYFWGASLGGSTTTGGDIEVGIDSLLDDLKMGGMAAIGASNGAWSFFADLIYLDVGDSGSVGGTVGGIPATVNASMDLKGLISTLGAGYRFYERSGTALDVTGGAWVLWLDGTVTAAVPPAPQVSASENGSNWDAVVGLRGRTELSDRWYMTYYADVGAGQSDLTWQAALAFNYELEKVDLSFCYRYLDWDLNNYGPFDELNMSGAFVGVKIPF